jgi:outer membrane lipoprotein-sorting protein
MRFQLRSGTRSSAHRAPLSATLLITLLLALILVSACGGSADVDPKTVLSQASTNMKNIQGFHFVYEVHSPSNAQAGSELEIARITGDINAKGDMQATIDLTQSGVPFSLQFVAVGETQYIQNPLSQKWESVPVKDSPVGNLNLNAGTIRILDQMTSVSYAGEEKKGGVQTHHVKGTAAAADVAAIAGAVSTTNPFPTDIWIGVKDGLVYEVDIAGPATASEDAKIWRSIVLSKLNVSVDIKAPQ